MSQPKIVYVPGMCAGHLEHPELLWVFAMLPSGKLQFHHIEIDFPEPADSYATQIQKFDVDMSHFERCPYCEAELYFFCKRCYHLSCFDWSQVDDDNKWTCFHCWSQYRMKLKTTPFRVIAHVGDESALPGDTVTTQHLPTNIPSQHNPQHTLQSSINSTQLWHPKGK